MMLAGKLRPAPEQVAPEPVHDMALTVPVAVRSLNGSLTCGK